MQPIRLLDAYKDIKYARLKGEKNEVFFNVEFDEGKFYPTDNGYVLMANVIKYTGVVRAYKPELPIETGVCAIPFYSNEYELWEKDKEGKSSPRKCQPSLYERNLCAHIALEFPEDKYFKGSISFLPDVQLTNLTDEDVINTIKRNCLLEEVAPSGNLPEYQATSSTYKKTNGYNRLTPADKATWVKKELCQSVKESGYNEEMSLADLTEQFVVEHQENETFLALYFDLLKAILA
ncbi:MAG: hypothetical protein QNJ41_18270 [Xenococcaceae cyanobacterium MO_188.B32]|nr:hypothetical protein [Xenococcaceae cyanobacterium MO_188.B32]